MPWVSVVRAAGTLRRQQQLPVCRHYPPRSQIESRRQTNANFLPPLTRNPTSTSRAPFIEGGALGDLSTRADLLVTEFITTTSPTSAPRKKTIPRRPAPALIQPSTEPPPLPRPSRRAPKFPVAGNATYQDAMWVSYCGGFLRPFCTDQSCLNFPPRPSSG